VTLREWTLVRPKIPAERVAGMSAADPGDEATRQPQPSPGDPRSCMVEGCRARMWRADSSMEERRRPLRKRAGLGIN
jgi:hypothetical protein